MDGNLPNFAIAFIFIRSRLGWLPPMFCLFVAEVQPLSAVRNVFLLNMFRTQLFYSMKTVLFNSSRTGNFSKSF